MNRNLSQWQFCHVLKPRTDPGYFRWRGYAGGMGKDLKRGDDVTWRSHGTTVSGTVEKKITSRTEAAGRTVAASKEDPQYLVKSKKTGREAVHKPESLTGR